MFDIFQNIFNCGLSLQKKNLVLIICPHFLMKMKKKHEKKKKMWMFLLSCVYQVQEALSPSL